MKNHLIILLALLSLASCSMFTKQGRQERAYEHYLRKSQVVRNRQRIKFRLSRAERRSQKSLREASDATSPGPQSVTAAAEQAAPTTEASTESNSPNE